MLTRRGILAAGSVAVAASGCSVRTSDTHRNVLRIAAPTLPDQLDPLLTSRNDAMMVAGNLLETLLAPDLGGSWTYAPGLAEQWQRIDGRTIEVRLRHAVRFSTGEPMTAEDVAFSLTGWERVKNPNSVGAKAGGRYLGGIERVDILAPDTIRIVSTRPDSILEHRIGNWGGNIISKRAFEAAANWDAWARSPVGTGPYFVSSFAPGDVLRLKANPHYWGQAPQFAAVEFRQVPEPFSRIAGLLSGEFDIASDVAPDLFPLVRQRSDFDVVGGPTANTRTLRFDLRNPMLRDPNLRRAIGCAIDRAQIVEHLWSGATYVSRGSQLRCFGSTFAEELPHPAYDPDKARALIAQSTYSGGTIPYETLASDYYTNQRVTAETIQQMLDDVGIRVKLYVRQNWGQMRRPPEVGLLDASEGAIYPDPLGHHWMFYGPEGVVQTTKQWRNGRYNELGGRLATTTDPHERHELSKEMLEVLDWADPAASHLHVNAMFYAKRADLDWKPSVTPMINLAEVRLRSKGSSSS